MLGFLDPATWEEDFRSLSPLNLETPPVEMAEQMCIAAMTACANRMAGNAIKRGASSSSEI